MSTELITIPKKTALTVFTTAKGLDPIIERIRCDALSLIADVSTKKGRDAIASNAAKVSRSKTYLDGVGKDLVDKLKEQPKLIDAERKRVRDALDALRDEVRKPLTDWEEAEEKRIGDIRSRIERMKLIPIDGTIEQLKTHLFRLKSTEINDSFEEFKSDAALAKMDAITRAEGLIEKATIAENEKAELERLRKEAEQKAQSEREERLIKDAEERARKQAEEDAQKAINEAKAAEERAKAQAFEAQERERIAKESEEKRIQEAIEAEVKRITDEAERNMLAKESPELEKNLMLNSDPYDITLPRSRWLDLLRKERKLDALEGYGVNDWEGYEGAMQIYMQNTDEIIG